MNVPMTGSGCYFDQRLALQRPLIFWERNEVGFRREGIDLGEPTRVLVALLPYYRFPDPKSLLMTPIHLHRVGTGAAVSSCFGREECFLGEGLIYDNCRLSLRLPLHEGRVRSRRGVRGEGDAERLALDVVVHQ